MQFSKRCQYGIKAAIYLARRADENGYCQSREIAQAEDLPGKFLESILLTLRSAELLESKVGAGGGYQLAKQPDAIEVQEIISALNNTDSNNFEEETDDLIGTEGSIAITILDQRMSEAYEQAIGSLTLKELVEMVDEQADASAAATN